jgi:hypothetical protein
MAFSFNSSNIPLMASFQAKAETKVNAEIINFTVVETVSFGSSKGFNTCNVVFEAGLFFLISI